MTARRAARALAGLLALAAAVAPALAASPVPAAASTSPAAVAFTALTPQWAAPGTTLTVTGMVKNTSPSAASLTVRLFYSPDPVGSVSDLTQSAALSPAGQAALPLPNPAWTSPRLQPGGIARWSFRVPVRSLQATSFGVYKIDAEVSDPDGTVLNNSLTYVPYVPAARGRYAGTIPAAQKVAVVWPLMDVPLLDAPWQDACSGPQAAALAASLAPGGTLNSLVSAAASRAAASSDALTWAVDPALLANATAQAGCGSRQPRWAAAAASWLAQVRTVTAGQPLFATPYGDPDLATVIGAGPSTAADADNAFAYGRRVAAQILHRGDVVPPAPGAGQDVQPVTAGIAWSAGGPADYSTLEHLASRDKVGTLVLPSTAEPGETQSVLTTPDGGLGGGSVTLLLASDSLTNALRSASAAPGSAVSAGQLFLAETALMASQAPSAPIIIAPPRRWEPPAGMAASLLTAIASAPWLNPVTLASLATAPHAATGPAPKAGTPPAFGQRETRALRTLDSAVTRLQALRQTPDPDLYLAVAATESSGYRPVIRKQALSLIASLTRQVTAQEQGVRVVAENRITLGGTSGSVPISVDNRLGVPVQVRVAVSYPPAGQAKITATPPGLVTVQAHNSRTVHLKITTSRVGSTTITVSLLNRDGQPVASPSARTTVQTTRVGQLGLIIFAVALAAFLIASAVRALRRGRPHGPPGEPGPPDGHRPTHSARHAAPDTVVAEPDELGTAGSRRLR